MTFKEKLQKEHPEAVVSWAKGGCLRCPSSYGYEAKDIRRCPQTHECWTEERCTACWNREIPGTEPKFEAFKTRYLCEWPKENPHLTEHAKSAISKKIYLNPSDFERLMASKQAVLGYIQQDLSSAYDLQRFVYEMACVTGYEKRPTLKIKKVIFNDPATIVIWADGEKTVVKCQNGEPYDPEKGLAMAITKRALGNKGNYFDEIKKWTKEYKAKKAPVAGISVEEAVEGFKKLSKAAKIRRKNDV